MALIECKNCHRQISDRADDCIHCGAKIIKEEQEEKPKEEKIVKRETKEEKTKIVEEKEHKKLFLNKTQILLLTTGESIILIILVLVIGTIHTRFSGVYNIIQGANWILNKHSMSFSGIEKVISIMVIGYIGLCLLLINRKKKVAHVFAALGYSFMGLVELIFLLCIYSEHWHPNIMYILLMLLTMVCIAQIIFIFPKKEQEEIETVKTESSSSNLEELKKLKELLDMEAITKKEYEELKKELLEKEKEKWH